MTGWELHYKQSDDRVLTSLMLSFSSSVSFFRSRCLSRSPNACNSTVLISILPKCVMAFATFHANKYTLCNVCTRRRACVPVLHQEQANGAEYKGIFKFKWS